MTFGQCIECWKKHPGKAFRRAAWPEGHYMELSGGLLWHEGDDCYEVLADDLFATDWEEC